MWKIALVDDKDYWKNQIIASFPENINYEFYYFDSYEKALWKKFDVLFLDYYLDKDWLKGEDIIDKLEADIIIGFSSVSSCNERLEKLWASFSVQKTGSFVKDEKLKSILNSILKNE